VTLRIHLVRHGEVHNPGHLVYARLAGFGLSPRGRRQARAAAAHLADRPIVAVWSSPLQRALETAAEIALPRGLVVQVDERLGEWRLTDRWQGIPWDDLATVRPGEVEAYLAHPHRLPFSAESLDDLARRMADALDDVAATSGGDVVVVGHQDPLQAVRLFLTGQRLSGLHDDKPRHATVITLEPGVPWRERERWDPPDHDLPPPTNAAITSASAGNANSGSAPGGK